MLLLISMMIRFRNDCMGAVNGMMMYIYGIYGTINNDDGDRDEPFCLVSFLSFFCFHKIKRSKMITLLQ